ncbi:MAG: hypothetical protein E4H01_05765 [Lysobacterales bacterium]|nr:MAG: hypothetical protein E4H01_05765 [Xanthomonadales bacterium]
MPACRTFILDIFFQVQSGLELDKSPKNFYSVGLGREGAWYQQPCFRDEAHTFTVQWSHFGSVFDSAFGGGCALLDVEPTTSQRRRFGLFILSVYRDLRTVYPGGFESFLVATCAAIGNRNTGRPVNVSSIAKMTGIPRPTVIRKLHLLEELGVARRTETSKGSMIYMLPESWDQVRPHVERLLEFETEMATTDKH